MILAIHLIFLISAAAAVARRVAVDRLHRILVTFVVAWAVVVLTAEGLSPLSLVGSPWAFAGLSLFLAAAAVWASRRFLPAPDPRDAPALASDPLKHFTWPLFWAAGVATVALAFIALCYHTNNPDCVQGYLPRVVFVRDQGHLGHLPQSDDFRTTFTPTNGVAAHVYLLLFTRSDLLLPIFNLACWLVLFVAVAALAKELGATASTAWMAAFAGALTCGPMMQAATTNFDLTATAPLVAALACGARWVRKGLARHALLAGIGLGLSIGTKPSLYFYFPWMAFVGVVGLWAIVARRIWPDAGRGRVAVQVALLIAGTLLLGSSWLIRNHHYKGRLSPEMERLDNAQWMRPGFDVESAGRGTLLHLVQHVLNPFAATAPDMAAGEMILRRSLKFRKWLPVEPPGGRGFPFQLGYRAICEDTAWFGFAGALVWLPAVAVGLLPWVHRSVPVFLLSGSTVVWLLTYYGYTTWYPWNGRYAIMPYVVGAAVIACLLTRLKGRVRVRTFTVLTGALSALLFFSFTVDFGLAAQRNLRRNLFEAWDNARHGRRKHFMSYGSVKDEPYYSFDAVNVLKDLADLAGNIRTVSYLAEGDYGRPFATMTTLGFDKRYVWRDWTSPQADDEMIALPYDMSLLYTPSRPGLATGLVFPATEEGTAYFALPPSWAPRLAAAHRHHPFLAFWISADESATRIYCFGRAGPLRYRVEGESDWCADRLHAGPGAPADLRIEFDEDGDGSRDAVVAIPRRRFIFVGGYPAPPLLADRASRLVGFKTLGEWVVRARKYASEDPFDVQVLLWPNGGGPVHVAASADGVRACNLADLPLDLSPLAKGSWCVVLGIRRSDSPNRDLAPPQCFDDYVIFDIELKE